MPDEPSDNDQPSRMPPDPGPIRSRPIGPMGLRSWSRRPYIVTGVAVVALLGGAGAALAATGTGTNPAGASAVVASPAPSPGQQGLPGVPRPPGPGHRFGFGLGLGGMFGALHGQLVVPKSGGGYQTVDVQDGQVTAVSTTSITLKSADGFTKSYAVASSTVVDAQRDGIGSVKVGNQAAVLATVSGSTATATNIADLTLLRQGLARRGLWSPVA